MEYKSSRNRIKTNTWTGLLLLIIGGALLLRQTGYPLPYWLFSWEMILITIGILIGVRNRFQDLSWFIMVVVGLIFLSDDIYPEFRLRQYAVPVIVIAVGLLFIFAPKRVCRGRHRPRNNISQPGEEAGIQPAAPAASEPSLDTTLDIVSIFAGIKKNVLSKQFRGGEIVCVFGGAEINLTNSDFTSPITIDVVNVFGGTKLIIPSNWEVRSEATAIFGGIDDKRPSGTNINAEKTVTITGTIMFGGIEIKSF